MTPSLNAEFMVPTRSAAAEPDDRLPLVVFPRALALDSSSAGQAVRACVGRYLHKLGSIMFRGFALHEEDALREFARAAGAPLGAAPAATPFTAVTPARRPAGRPTRDQVPHECPACGSAAPHSASLTAARAQQLWLHCQEAPLVGADSLVADNRAVYQCLPAQLRARFAERGLLYVRNFTAPAWVRAFGTRARHEVESWCRRHTTQLEWKADGGLRLLRQGSAVSRHPVTDERLWLNQLHLFYTALPPWSSRRLPAVDRDGLASNVYYADGAIIEASAVQEIRAAYERSSSLVRWEPGDVLLLDDLLTAHWHSASAQRSVRSALGA